MGIEDIFNDESLYTKKSFKLFLLKNDNYFFQEKTAKEFFDYIGIHTDKIVCKCNCCNMVFPFNVEKRFINFSTNINSTTYYLDVLEEMNFKYDGRISLSSGKLFGDTSFFPKKILAMHKKWYIEYQLTCTNNPDHKYIFIISIEQCKNVFTIRKIGQDPSMLDVHGYDFDKYKKQLEKINAYEDYKKADLSFSAHFYAGAYVYIRRIFEKMINKYIKDNNVELENNSIDSKIKSVKDCFDPRIRGLLKNLYNILSKGIHEFDDEQCKNYFESLKAIIDIQLEYIYTEDEKNKQSKELKTELDRISNEIK